MKLVSTAAGLGAVLVLAACGGGSGEESGDGSGEEASAFADGSAEDITAAAEEDMKALSSLRMAGSITNDGQEISIDVALSTAGDCAGDLSLGEDAGFELLSVGGETWIKPSVAFWEQFAGPAASQVAEAAGDKWVAFPGDEADDFADICDLDSLLDEFEDEDEGPAPEVEGTEDVDGQEAVVVTSTSDDGEPVKAWVATEDPHHILQLEVNEGDEPGRINFSDFDTELDLEAPAEDEVFDISQFQPGAS
jgi:hypothetical protein